MSASPASRAERKPGLRKSATAAVAGSADVPAGLDWQAFSAAYFPGRRRHDLESLTAYGAYRRSRVGEERTSEAADRVEDEDNRTAGSTAVGAWEDEGGADP